MYKDPKTRGTVQEWNGKKYQIVTKKEVNEKAKEAHAKVAQPRLQNIQDTAKKKSEDASKKAADNLNKTISEKTKEKPALATPKNIPNVSQEELNKHRKKEEKKAKRKARRQAKKEEKFTGRNH
jgi:hypothetical protein